MLKIHTLREEHSLTSTAPSSSIRRREAEKIPLPRLREGFRMRVNKDCVRRFSQETISQFK
jgi:hypothetical protein